MLDVFEVEKVLPQFRFADSVRRLMIMCGQLAHGSGVRLLSSLRQTAELQTLDHSLSQFAHGYTSDGKVEQPAFLDRKRRAVFQKCIWTRLARENDRVIERKVFTCAQRLVQQALAADRNQ